MADNKIIVDKEKQPVLYWYLMKLNEESEQKQERYIGELFR